ncbi:hypothetical protein AJ80_09634 [Polytolypa hystricis UAMH7299]|uniref:Uncharacterized protein n=1 Tax=Polytolypa hystricis (strain UAMH7299) TaxID=1447883 RepID=A0A2B7WMR8_POLH7|nr:hypothetical protein AJ80_09634 [Polytolypa hystricis UAMH7299]
MFLKLAKQFFNQLDKDLGNEFPDPYSATDSDSDNKVKVNLCTYIGAYWIRHTTIAGQPNPKKAPQWIADEYPTTKNGKRSSFCFLGH